jgi:hypothetical protein
MYFQKMGSQNSNKPKPIFEPDLVCPSDGIGSYVDLVGIVISSVSTFDSFLVQVQTLDRKFSAISKLQPKPGFLAVVRIYQSGGGFYPDNRVITLKDPKSLISANR